MSSLSAFPEKTGLFYQLSIETVAMILGCLDNIGSLVPTLLASSRFMDAFETVPGIAEKIIQRQVHPHLLPLAIAIIDARHGKYKHREEVAKLGHDIWAEPEQFTDRLNPHHLDQTANHGDVLSTRSLIHIGYYYTFIGKVVDYYALHAWRIAGAYDAVNLSETERVRFYRAFYLLELYILVSKRYAEDGGFIESPAHEFLRALPPWEWEQMACAQRYLLSWVILSGYHELKVDESTHNRDINATVWGSQGLGLLMKFDKADSVEAKKNLLARAWMGKCIFLQDDMVDAFEYRYLAHPWGTMGQEGFQIDIPDRGPYEDEDTGPLETWITAHVCPTCKDWWIGWEGAIVLVSLAYVF
ncbi:hypothetical protein O1611_g6873 [Lasiodiplodia mahajangana]|uniref:Uncharacterized protein n=1 Tax=Lasiodiplodia mahajangana TaxID=1108764 RepID=A0ACC2JHC1_9PEZI|nr:hypothetical protein O1611_g6873 [Lasiodiplodia mahajangana]